MKSYNILAVAISVIAIITCVAVLMIAFIGNGNDDVSVYNPVSANPPPEAVSEPFGN